MRRTVRQSLDLRALPLLHQPVPVQAFVAQISVPVAASRAAAGGVDQRTSPIYQVVEEDVHRGCVKVKPVVL